MNLHSSKTKRTDKVESQSAAHSGVDEMEWLFIYIAMMTYLTDSLHEARCRFREKLCEILTQL